MNAHLPPVLAQALAPFAPPQSIVHQIVADTRVSEAERRELMAIVDHHNDEYRSGLDKVGAPWDRDEDEGCEVQS